MTVLARTSCNLTEPDINKCLYCLEDFKLPVVQKSSAASVSNGNLIPAVFTVSTEHLEDTPHSTDQEEYEALTLSHHHHHH
jgi:hypothetical protein